MEKWTSVCDSVDDRYVRKGMPNSLMMQINVFTQETYDSSADLRILYCFLPIAPYLMQIV